jgi:excisionase family DNA binding protein
MALRRLDPETFSEDERASLREQIEKLLDLAKQHSEGPPPAESTGEEMTESPLFSKENQHRSSLKGEKKRILELLKTTIEEEPSRLNVKIGEGEVDMPLPRDLMTMILEIMTEVAQGHSVSVGPEEEELTTSEAAELLNVSRPHLVKLLEEGELPFRKVGTHRRVRREDVLEYKRRQRKEAEEAMQNLADQAQELGLGY